jgi:Putative adhesin
MRRPLLVLGSAFAAITIAYGTFTAVSFMAHGKERSDVSFPSTITAIELDLSSGDAMFTGGDGDTITGVRTTERGLTSPRYKEQIDGTTLKISASCPWFIGVNCNVRYELNVPANVRVTGSNSGGDIHTQGVTGVRKVSSSGGDVMVTGSTDPISASSSGGDVSVLASRSADVKADSSGGDVTAEFVDIPTTVDVSSSGGDVTIVLPRGEVSYAVDASSSGGNTRIDVRTDPTSTHRIKATSSGGDVSIVYSA